MAVKQAVTALVMSVTGTAHVVVPSDIAGVSLHPAAGVYVVVEFPTTTAGVCSPRSSRNDGTSWCPADALLLHQADATFPTAAAWLGGVRSIFGPFLPGAWFSLPHSASTATAEIYFMA